MARAFQQRGIFGRQFVVMAAAVLMLSAGASWAAPTRITTIEEFQTLPQNDPTGSFILANDIDASTTTNWNGGAGFAPINDFAGTMDGNGHTIGNLYMNRPEEDKVAAFGTNFTGTIINLRLNNVSVTGKSEVAGLVVESQGTVRRCAVEGIVTSTEGAAGLLIAFAVSGSITECFSGGTVSALAGSGYCGGLVAGVWGPSVSNSYSTAAVLAPDGYSGGLVGLLMQSSVSNCYARGNVGTGTKGINNGGLVSHLGGGSLINCFSTGTVAGSQSGGLVASVAASGTATNCYWDLGTSGQATSAVGTGLSTDAMKHGSSFSGWDFANTWNYYYNAYPDLVCLYQYTTYPYIMRAAGQADTSGASLVSFDVQFRATPWGAPSDMSQSGGPAFGHNSVNFSASTATIISWTVTPVTGSGNSEFTISVTAHGNGTVIPNVAKGVCDYKWTPNYPNLSTDNIVNHVLLTPHVAGIACASTCNHLRDQLIDYEVTFEYPVKNVSVADFSLSNSTVSGAAVLSATPVNPVSGHSTVYTVSVDAGTGGGAVQLDVLDRDTVTTDVDEPLGGVGVGNGDFSGADAKYYIDKRKVSIGGNLNVPGGYSWDDFDLTGNPATISSIPAGATLNHDSGSSVFTVTADSGQSWTGGAFTVNWSPKSGPVFCQELATAVAVKSITRENPSLPHTPESNVTFKATFTDAVKSVTAADFRPAVNGSPVADVGVSVTPASESGADPYYSVYMVTLTNLPVRGVVSLDVVNNNTILDKDGASLGAPFTGGESFAVDQTIYRIGDAIPIPLDVAGVNDGRLKLLDAYGKPVTTSVPSWQVFDSTRDAADNYVTNTFFVSKAVPAADDLGHYSSTDSSGLFVGDNMTVPPKNTHPKGYTTITWKRIDDTTFDQEIRISNTGDRVADAAHVPMHVYITDLSTSGTISTAAYKVMLAPANGPATYTTTIHHNSQIRPSEEGQVPGVFATKYLWVDETGKWLHAYSDTGLVVIHFESDASQFLGVQVVDVRTYSPDSTQAMDLGDELVPKTALGAGYKPATEFAEVTAGKSDATNNGYIYQHSVSGSKPEGRVFALKENTVPADAEVFWMRYCEGVSDGVKSLGIRWPYEMARYTFTWPDETNERSKFQLYVRGKSPDPVGPGVVMKNSTEFLADVMPYKTSADGFSGYSVVKQPAADGIFATNGPGWSLLRFQLGDPGHTAGQDDVSFLVVRSAWHDNSNFFPNQGALHPWPIGVEITDPYHKPSQPYHTYTQAGNQWQQTPGTPGYLFIASGSGENRYDWKLYDGNNSVDAVTADPATTGQITPVNTGKLEVWWYNHAAKGGHDWPSLPMRYDCAWPGSTKDEIVIARQDGTGKIPYKTWDLYYQNDSARPGFNPNDEHAWKVPYDSGTGVFALRCDLGKDDASLPYVLVKYVNEDGPNPKNLWRYNVYSVVAEKIVSNTEKYTFSDWPQRTISTTSTAPQDPYEKWAGALMQAPFPLVTTQYCSNNKFVSGPAFTDREGFHWAKAAGNHDYYNATDPDPNDTHSPKGDTDDDTANIVMQYFYKNQAGFYWPSGETHADGEEVPWLDRLTGGTRGTPVNVTYTIHWPDNVPTMQIGDLLVKARYGLPAMRGHLSARILYQQATALDSEKKKTSAKVIDFKRTRPVPPASPVVLNGMPSDVETQMVQGTTYFPKLSPALKPRVVYNSANSQIGFTGFFVEPALGEYYAFLNVMTEADHNELRDLSSSVDWKTSIDTLYGASRDVVAVPDDSVDFEPNGLALTTGFADAGGYVTLMFENAVEARPLPVCVEVIKVVEKWKPGEVAVINPDCPFDERLVLMHKGDFDGQPDQYKFEWKTLPDMDGTPPASDINPLTQSPTYANWNAFTPDPADGVGAHTITIEGPGVFTLSDNWFVCRYTKKSAGAKAWPDDWSDWTQPQLAPGWIKRVVGKINPFTQRATGGGIEGAEVAFSSFGDNSVNTTVSMISQAGPRWGGNVPLNCGNLNDFGLIEIYETVFGRGRALSIDNGVNYPPANSALLLAAGRVSDLYMLLGNEAYADASDPTVAYGTDDASYGTEATSIHCFMNQTSTLLEEELALLRGRDDSQSPPVSTSPVYNRLVWNFTNDMNGGEVAYALNYNIQDASGNTDGVINEYDAKKLYPQGHGDAWGHYLSALKRYYKLLRHPNFAWIPRAEAVMVGGVAVTVDYMDERKFAKAAAARAHAGSEIMNLTYRQYYTEDPAGQWQGYHDTDTDRQWGVSEWGSRAGMGAYFDWVEGNAILPPKDTDPAHTGIKKIDRTTVRDLAEIPAAYAQIEAVIENANTGLNPLGLAKDVTPFDIDPAAIDAGQTHFEQIYERAHSALDNALKVFNNAVNCTQLLRRQSDSLAAFQKNVADQEADFNNRLIESFGYPYAEDIGPTGSYPTGYNGPDLYHYDYVDDDVLRQNMTGDVQPFTLNVSERYVDANGEVRDPSAILAAERTESDNDHIKAVNFSISLSNYGMVKPAGWTSRRAPGEIQLARSDLLQAAGNYKKCIQEYNDTIGQIEDQVKLIDDKAIFLTTNLALRATQFGVDTGLDAAIVSAKAAAGAADALAQICGDQADALKEAFPMVVGAIGGVACGTIMDTFSACRTGAKLAGVGAESSFLSIKNASEDAANTLEVAKELTDQGFEIGLVGLEGAEVISEETDKLAALARQEEIKKTELYTQQAALEQALGRYRTALAAGQRILEDRLRFRQQTAGQIQSDRYKDMAFRVFRNDALQKYQAQFNLAARYVYMTAKAYDYETNQLGSAGMAGTQFLTNVVRCRALGAFDENGDPMTGGTQTGDDPGLANIMAQMKQNFDLVLRGQLGFNNPQTETNRFSLRFGLFRTANDPASQGDDATWRETLRAHVVDDILTLPEFKQYCAVFQPHQATEPGIVIKFSTEITAGKNFFGWPLVGGDSAYSSTHFATKIRSNGVWFGNYQSLVGGTGLSETPRVYLVPAGEDRMRSPNGGNEVRSWRVLDQKLPVPFPIGSSALSNPVWIPQMDSFGETFASIRRLPDFRAYHDSGSDWPSELDGDSRLVGRSVWNTKWVLIIPAVYLGDRATALDTFIDGSGGNGGVSDILLFFQTYAYASGSKSAQEGGGAEGGDPSPNAQVLPITPGAGN